MRTFRLTKKGKEKVRVVSQGREELLDYLYPNKVATLEELKGALVGSQVSTLIRDYIRKGLVEEVSDGSL